MFALLLAATWTAAGQRLGSSPAGPWACPETHPIKGYMSQETGRRLYFLPGSPFYDEASPERCYATEGEARRDGSQRPPDSGEPSAPPPGSL